MEAHDLVYISGFSSPSQSSSDDDQSIADSTGIVHMPAPSVCCSKGSLSPMSVEFTAKENEAQAFMEEGINWLDNMLKNSQSNSSNEAEIVNNPIQESTIEVQTVESSAQDGQAMTPPKFVIPWKNNKVRQNYSKHQLTTAAEYKSIRNKGRRASREKAIDTIKAQQTILKVIEREWSDRKIKSLEAYYEENKLTDKLYYRQECLKFWQNNKTKSNYSWLISFTNFERWLSKDSTFPGYNKQKAKAASQNNSQRLKAAEKNLTRDKIIKLELILDTTSDKILQNNKKKQEETKKRREEEIKRKMLFAEHIEHGQDILAQSVREILEDN